MPPTRSKKTRRSFWREWGVYLVVAGLILLGALVWQLSRPRSPDLAPAEHYQLHFTQGGEGDATPADLVALITADIAAAQGQVDLATPGLDLDEIATALIEAHNRGVKVRVLEDEATQDDDAVSAVSERLVEAGVPLKVRRAEGTLGGAFVVVDGKIAWAGSWEINRQALEQGASCVVRFALLQEGDNFATEFAEMFDEGAFGPSSPQNTPHTFLSMLEGGAVSVYFTPEDDPLAEILNTIARVDTELTLLTEGIEDARLVERLADEAALARLLSLGVFESQGFSDAEALRELHDAGMDLRVYKGPGRLQENVIIVDSQIAILSSQPFVQQHLEQNDGYIMVLRGPDIGQAFEQEFLRVFGLAQDWP